VEDVTAVSKIPRADARVWRNSGTWSHCAPAAPHRSEPVVIDDDTHHGDQTTTSIL